MRRLRLHNASDAYGTALVEYVLIVALMGLVISLSALSFHSSIQNIQLERLIGDDECQEGGGTMGCGRR